MEAASFMVMFRQVYSLRAQKSNGYFGECRRRCDLDGNAIAVLSNAVRAALMRQNAILNVTEI